MPFCMQAHAHIGRKSALLKSWFLALTLFSQIELDISSIEISMHK